MFKKLLTIIIKQVLWPLLKILFQQALQQLAQWLFDQFHGFLRKWRKQEEESASTEEEREFIRKKYERREADLDAVEQELPEKVREIVQAAFNEADMQTDLLITATEKTPALQDATRDIRPPNPKELTKISSGEA